jgi:hypothetical protein
VTIPPMNAEAAVCVCVCVCVCVAVPLASGGVDEDTVGVKFEMEFGAQCRRRR